MLKQPNTKSGFTIIEVVLVLAIGGMIFLMVFLGFPALRRSSNDNQRFRDLSRLQNAITKYQENNRGQIPTKESGTNVEVEGRSQKSDETPAVGSWDYFYDNYLLVDSAGNLDVFADPNGTPYGLHVTSCEEGGCDDTGLIQRSKAKFDDQAKSTGDFASLPKNSIAVVTNATCEGELIKYSAGDRNIAIAYKLEGGGSKCVNL